MMLCGVSEPVTSVDAVLAALFPSVVCRGAEAAVFVLNDVSV